MATYDPTVVLFKREQWLNVQELQGVSKIVLVPERVLKARTFSMGRAPCCSKVGLNRGPWTAREDSLLKKYIENHGEGNWRSLPKKAGLLRCGKSCRLRWMNYLRPNIKRGNMEPEEDDLIIKLHALLGNRWSLIARRLPGRTDNEIKNYWNTHLSKALWKKGIDPRTHRPLQPGAPNTTPPCRPAPRATENKARTGKKEAADGPPPIKVHVPKATRVDPFTFISKLRYNMAQLASLTRTQETGTSTKVPASSPSEATSDMETKDASAIEREVSAVPKSPLPAVSDLSSPWPELELWIDDEDGRIALMDDHSGKGTVCVSIFNSIMEEERECYDNLNWLTPL